MIPLILAVVTVLVALAVLQVIPLALAGLGILVMLLVAGWRFDRARRPGAPAPYRDANRPDFYGRSSTSHWEVPTPYIDHPDGGGEPPGVDRGDEPAPRA